MSNTNTGGPAFPQHGFDVIAERFTSQGGMTLRDYFAAKVVQTYLADPAFSNVTQGTIARLAYDMADSMLEAREA
jgi:hypothetical protein